MTALSPQSQASSRTSRILLVNGLAWGTQVVLEAVARFVDAVRRGATTPGVLPLISTGAVAWLPWFLFTTVAYIEFSRHDHRLWSSSDRSRWRGRVAVILLFVPAQVSYQTLWFMFRRDIPLREFAERFRAWPVAFWVIDAGILVGSLAVVIAISAMRVGQREKERRARAEADNLGLRLELEQRNLAALRAQLEPHFLFNSLNAISALVRSEDVNRALEALRRLSDLLRHALSATLEDWIPLENELRFVRSYVQLQALRFGDRLQFSLQGDVAGVADVPVPALLFQPLVENAIRHGVERQSGRCELVLTLTHNDDEINIMLVNTQSTTGSAAGFGVGLRSTQDRLRLLYGDRSWFSAGAEGELYIVRLRIPTARDA